MTEVSNTTEERAWRDQLKTGDEVMIVSDSGRLYLETVAELRKGWIVTKALGETGNGDEYSRATGINRYGELRLLPPTDERRKDAIIDLLEDGGMDWGSHSLAKLQQIHDLLMLCEMQDCRGGIYAPCVECGRLVCRSHGGFGRPCVACVSAAVAAAGQPPAETIYRTTQAGTSWAEVTMDLRAALVPTEQESN